MGNIKHGYGSLISTISSTLRRAIPGTRTGLSAGILVFSLAALGACSSPEPPAADLTGAWAHYTASLDRAEQTIRSSKYFTNPAAQADAYGHLAGLIGLTQRKHIAFGDPAFPHLLRVVGLSNKWGFSNPDNVYLASLIDDRYSYRIRGRLGTANQTTFGSYAGDTKEGKAGKRFYGEDLITDAEGNFELIFSKQPQPGNWLPLVEGATSITIYQIFADWDREEKGTYQIERIGSAGESPEIRGPAEMAARYIRAGDDINHILDYWLSISDSLSWISANTLAKPRIIQIASYGSYFVFGGYEIKEDEALVIEMPIPDATRYWGWTLYNPWSETLDYANRQTSLNHTQAKADDDGMLRIVLAHTDPGVANWLDISGHPTGYLNWRVTTDNIPERPETKRVPLNELKQHLPASTTLVDASQRQQIIARRQAHVARRYAN